MSKAKQRARLALKDPSIPLTTLERSFYDCFRRAENKAKAMQKHGRSLNHDRQ